MENKTDYNNISDDWFTFNFWFGCALEEFIIGLGKLIFGLVIVALIFLSMGQCGKYVDEISAASRPHRPQYLSEPPHEDCVVEIDSCEVDTISDNEYYDSSF